MELLLNRRRFRGMTQYLVRGVGARLAGGRVAAGGGAGSLPRSGGGVRRHRADSPRCALRHTPGRGPPSTGAAPSSTSGGSYTDLAARPRDGGWPAELISGKALIGRSNLSSFRWPDMGWVCGGLLSRAAGFSRHVVAYGLQSAGSLARCSMQLRLPLKARGGGGYCVCISV